MSDRDARSSEPDRETVRRFYDEVYWSSPDRHPASLDWHTRRMLRRVGSMDSKRVLDVACGDALVLRELARHGVEVAGIDISPVAIATARAALPDGDLHVGGADALPFADAVFDQVLCLGALEHFPEPVACLREMARVAKPGGRLVFAVPNADFLTRKFGFFRGTEQASAIEVPRTIESWTELFAAAELRVETMHRDLHVLSRAWIARGSPIRWPVRLAQALALPLWPLRWQYQIYFVCRRSDR